MYICFYFVNLKRMKLTYALLAVILSACNQTAKTPDSPSNRDSVRPGVELNDKKKRDSISTSPGKSYSNTRFKEVTLEKTGQYSYTVQGKGQIFEANFGWVIEDGHDELQNGFQMTDAGAPEWGQFKFSIEVQKPRPNSRLTLILFESSAKDGSRQYELPIPLE
jgi:hypothetical protein